MTDNQTVVAAIDAIRRDKMLADLVALRNSRQTAWYKRWARRADRSKYAPAECRAEGKR